MAAEELAEKDEHGSHGADEIGDERADQLGQRQRFAVGCHLAPDLLAGVLLRQIAALPVHDETELVHQQYPASGNNISSGPVSFE